MHPHTDTAEGKMEQNPPHTCLPPSGPHLCPHFHTATTRTVSPAAPPHTHACHPRPHFLHLPRSCHQDKISYYLMCSGFMPDKAKELQVGVGTRGGLRGDVSLPASTGRKSCRSGMGRGVWGHVRSRIQKSCKSGARRGDLSIGRQAPFCRASQLQVVMGGDLTPPCMLTYTSSPTRVLPPPPPP